MVQKMNRLAYPPMSNPGLGNTVSKQTTLSQGALLRQPQPHVTYLRFLHG